MTIIKLTTIIVMMAAMMGCQKEPSTSDNGNEDFGSEMQFTMSASMSDVAIPTKSLSEADENAITRLDVLVFNSDDTFAYTVQANTPTVVGNTLTYTVRLKKSIASEQYKLVLLANLAQAPTIVVGTAKEAALAAITFAPATTWNAGAKIPMWADYPTAAVVSTATANTAFGTTQLIRSIARINVTNMATTTFTLNKVWVYNTTDKARVAPVLTNYDRTNTKVTLPSIASGVGVTAVYGKAVTGNSLLKEIYIGESVKHPVGDAAAVCLVLEGTFDGKTNFYRMDMVGGDGKTPLDILRNHTYNVNITKVGGSGYDTKEDAFNSMPVNLTTEIKVWDDANLNDITTDGQYTLAVSKSLFEVEGQAGTDTIHYSTDYPHGVTVTINDNWLTTTPPTGSIISFSYSENPSITATRTGSITVTAGRIHKKIAITQTTRSLDYVGMFGGPIRGAGTEADPYQFSKPLYVQASDVSNGVVWDNQNTVEITTSPWDGRANAWTLNSIGFMASNLCFDKNTAAQKVSKETLVWYLPAQDQLMGIWVSHFGSGAELSTNSYWSSSAYSPLNSWYVNFSNGGTDNLVESSSIHVRCVKESTK